MWGRVKGIEVHYFGKFNGHNEEQEDAAASCFFRYPVYDIPFRKSIPVSNQRYGDYINPDYAVRDEREGLTHISIALQYCASQTMEERKIVCDAATALMKAIKG